MTDARLRGEWLTAPRMIDLSDRAWRVFTGALMWSAEQGTDGFVNDRSLRFLSESISPKAYAEIETAGLWGRESGGYQFIGWSTSLGQSTDEAVEHYRSRSRERQQRYRDTCRARALAESGRELSESEAALVRDVAERLGKRSGWHNEVLEKLQKIQEEVGR